MPSPSNGGFRAHALLVAALITPAGCRGGPARRGAPDAALATDGGVAPPADAAVRDALAQHDGAGTILVRDGGERADAAPVPTVDLAAFTSGVDLAVGTDADSADSADSDNSDNSDGGAPPPPAGPRLSDAVKTGCYGFPQVDFSPFNHASLAPNGDPIPNFKPGDLAVDVTLHDLWGVEIRLSQLLADKPVLLVHGSYTCNVFQGNLPALNTLASMSWDGGAERWADKVHFVIVYTVEAHPAAPEACPYTGAPWPNQYSVLPQAFTYADRQSHAFWLSPSLDLNHEIFLLDGLTPGDENPEWCTYGACPNCGFLIDRDGIIRVVHPFLSVGAMANEIRNLVGP